jgi:two-component system, NtrC family, sensor kinase
MGEPSGKAIHRHCVLIVDDDELVLKSLHDILSRDGYDIITATGAEAALESLREVLPCMALLDVMMPGMNGLALCRRLKQDPRTAEIAVALVTGQVETVDVEAGLAAGAIDYIKKPFDPDELRVRVRTQLALHETQRLQRRTEMQLSVITSAAKDAIMVIDDSGAITQWNEASSAMFGYAHGEAIGRNLHDLIAPPRFHEAHRMGFARFGETGEGNAVGRMLELVAMRKSGAEFPVELSLAAANIDNKWCAVGIIRDISERKLKEDALRQSEEEYRLLYRSSRDALMTIAPPSWKFVSCNQATVELFAAASEAEFRQLGPWDVSPERQPDGRASAEAAQAMIEKAMREGSSSFPWLHQRLDGERLPCEVLLTRIDHNGLPFILATVRDITERVRATAALQASEARYRATFNDASVGLALADASGRFLEVNSALATLLGYSIDQLVGKNFSEVTHPDDVATSNGSLQALLSGRDVIRMEKRYLRKDGKEIWVDVNVAALRDSDGKVIQFVTHVVDISNRKRMEEELHREEAALRKAEQAAKTSSEFLNTILNAIPVPIFYKDTEGHFMGINRAYGKFFGNSQEDLVGKTVFDLFPKQEAQSYHEQDLELLRQPGTKLYSVQLTDSRGACHDVLAHKATFADGNGHVRGLLGALIDITDRTRVEAELGHARKLEAVGQLAAGIAHEINTPAQYVGDGIYFLKEVYDSCLQLLMKYQGALEALESVGTHATLVNEIRAFENEIDLQYIQANVPGSFDRCVDGISRISTIVRAMKEFSHPDQREKSPGDINQALQSTLIIAKNEYKYVANVETELGELPPVLCHLGDLNQVFLNLIVNAAHAIGDVVGKDGEKGQIRITTMQVDHSVQIDITDSGSGIPESIRDRIFEPFFTTKEVGKGSGQGLAIARSIVVDKHGGSLTFKSEVGHGTTFTIRLPVDGKGSARAVESP